MAPLVLCALHASTFRGTQLGRRPQRVVFARCTARLISGRARLVVQANELNKWCAVLNALWKLRQCRGKLQGGPGVINADQCVLCHPALAPTSAPPE